MDRIERRSAKPRRLEQIGMPMTFPLAVSGGFVALWSIIYFVLLVTLGVISIRKGHWVMFIVGIFIPLFWIIGALLPRRVR